VQKIFLFLFSLLFTLLTVSEGWALQCRSLFSRSATPLSYEETVVADAQSADGLLRLSLGGIGEIKNAVNINILVDPRHASMNIPHLIKSDMREMPFVKNSSVDQMFCHACPGSHGFFEQVVNEAHRVLKVDATFHITSNSSSAPWIAALIKRGFAIERHNDRSVMARKAAE
jgi:hypothetical protein